MNTGKSFGWIRPNQKDTLRSDELNPIAHMETGRARAAQQELSTKSIPAAEMQGSLLKDEELSDENAGWG